MAGLRRYLSRMSESTPELATPESAPVDHSRLEQEIARRRTFAIISHPDAGKTTLT
jgi:peptide chain release factor 3